MKIEKINSWFKISADEGFVLTEWNDTDDIIDFAYYKVKFSVSDNVDNVREITESEKDELMERRDEALEELEKQNRIEKF